jgi:S-adenosylmethionine hydrolase
MPTISLTTDFGGEDFYTAILKARILDKVQDAIFIDVSHKVQAFDITEAAYILGNVYDKFPKGTVHVVVVNWFMGQDESFISFEKDGHYFLGPNNGLFTLMFPELNEREVYQMPLNMESEVALQDAFANCIAEIMTNAGLQNLKPLSGTFQQRISIQPVISETYIRGTVIHIDHFENVIINVRKKQFEHVRKNRNFYLYYDPKHPITQISKSYSDVGIGDVLCLFNSAGYLELSVNMGKAASLLGLRKEDTIQIDFRK